MPVRGRTPNRAAGVATIALLWLLGGLGLAPGAPAQALTAQPVLGMPAQRVEFIGASPGEAPGETWAEGGPATIPGPPAPKSEMLLRDTSATGAWQVVPLDDAHGTPITFLWHAAGVTHAGGIVLAGFDNGPGSSDTETIVTRDPGGSFSEATPPSPTAVLRPGETLYPDSNVPVMTAIDAPGHVGVLIAPGSESPNPGVLHYLAGQWSREEICASSTNASTCTQLVGSLTPVALSGSSPDNAWLLAEVSNGSSTQLRLFQRQPGPAGAAVWVDLTPQNWLLGTGPPPPGTPAGESGSPPSSGAVLTASGSGVWLDLTVSVGTSAVGSASLFITPGGVVNTWCFPADPCPGAASLGAVLPGGYGSIAWPGGAPTDPGTRVITGLAQAAVLEFPGAGSSFSHDATAGAAAGTFGGGSTFGPGGEALTANGAQGGGAAFSSPGEGWIAVPPSGLTAGVQAVHVTSSPAPSALAPWPLPFRQPLLALATAPGSTPGDPNAQALAVGVGGEIARYTKGLGWVREFLYDHAGVVQRPTLRGVAWPTPERAFAVGDNGAMWVWLSETGLWEPDPAEPLNFHANLTAIAFSPSNPNLGYAVGKQGALLAYDKTWTQQTLPAAVAQAHLTSIAFAGGQAVVGYRMIDPSNPFVEEGGVLVNNGSGWTIDQGVAGLLATLPADQTVISKVAGLPDGGAVAAGPGVVLERDSANGPWRFSNQPLGDSVNGNIGAVAAIRTGPTVSALVAVDDDPESGPSNTSSQHNLNWLNIDNPQAVAAGQPPLLIAPDPLPSRGFLLRETSAGWVDLESQDFPNLLFGGGPGSTSFDLPGWPDPVFALDVDPAGDQGWVAGGQTGGPELQFGGDPGAAQVVQTAGVLRLGPGPAPPASTSAPIPVPQGQATFALGGGSGCDSPCADDAAQNLGPDAWLSAAINRANQISGLRAFLYAGQRDAEVGLAGSAGGADAYFRELARYNQLLSSGGSLPVYAAAAQSDVSSAVGGAPVFAQNLGAHVPAGTTPPGPQNPPSGTAAYAFDSAGAGGTVRVIVVDYSSGSLSIGGGAQLQWLASELDSARQAGIPAIVVGADDIVDPAAPNAAADGGAVQQVLLAHGASAYLFYDGEGQNVSLTIGTGANTIPAYGTGTLGYVTPPQTFAAAQAFLGASAFLLVSINAGQRSSTTNRAPVTATVNLNAGQLALDPTDGTLLRRSQVALFQGLARRPLGGLEFNGNVGTEDPDPYTVLPETCLGATCAHFMRPVYTFTSSNPTIGNFVEHDPNSTIPRQILQDSGGQPIPDPTSGLFCAYNPGTTTVTISAGGLSYSLPVTVQAGSVLEPCGTVPAGASSNTSAPAPAPGPPAAPQPSPGGSAPVVPVHVPPPPPAPAARVPAPAPLPVHALATLPAAPPTVGAIAVPPQLILPVATFTARPIPPIGFGTVPAIAPLPVRVVEEQKDEEEAVEHAQSNFAAYHPPGSSPVVPGIALLVLVLAAGAAGAGLRNRRRPRGGAAFARSEVRRDRRW
jgi:hypothetical protein